MQKAIYGLEIGNRNAETSTYPSDPEMEFQDLTHHSKPPQANMFANMVPTLP
jgi:hypothetical protein